MTTRLNGPPRVHQISVSHGGVPKLPVPEAKITVRGVVGDRSVIPIFMVAPTVPYAYIPWKPSRRFKPKVIRLRLDRPETM
jgi:hypothetical protein